ncbi:hypothetical protein WDU94_003661 [Cyamophila willieti]
MEFRRHAIHKIKQAEAQDLWTSCKDAILGVGETVLGKTSGKGRPKDKETWWWNVEVAKKIKEKKEAKKKWDQTNKPEDKAEYKRVNKEAKRAVAQAKAKELSDIYKEMETPEGEKNLYRLAKERDKASKDFTHIKQIKNKDGMVLKGEEEIKFRWKEYYNTLLNEENPRLPTEESLPNQGITNNIDRNEIIEALKAMKNGKATKAYDRVPRDEIWRCLRIAGAPEKYVRVVQDMYEKATTQIRSGVGLTDKIPVKVGLHQGSALSPYLFDVIMDVLTEGVRRDAPGCMLFADDVVLCGESAIDVERELDGWRKALEEKGLKINRTKTVQLNFGMENGDTIHLDGVNLNTVDKFKYLGSTIDSKGELDCEIAHRINAAWMNWKKMTGVLCDRRMNVRLKGKIHKTVVRPAMLYGAESWALKKVHEKKLEVAEMRMLRWSCGVTRLDRIRNEVIRNKLRVTEVTKKIQERRLQWYGHVMRRDEDYVGKIVNRMQVAGRRARGRPKKKWEHCVTKDLEEKGLSENDAQNRGRWKLLTRNADPT